MSNRTIFAYAFAVSVILFASTILFTTTRKDQLYERLAFERREVALYRRYLSSGSDRTAERALRTTLSVVELARSREVLTDSEAAAYTGAALVRLGIVHQARGHTEASLCCVSEGWTLYAAHDIGDYTSVVHLVSIILGTDISHGMAWAEPCESQAVRVRKRRLW